MHRFPPTHARTHTHALLPEPRKSCLLRAASSPSPEERRGGGGGPFGLGFCPGLLSAVRVPLRGRGEALRGRAAARWETVRVARRVPGARPAAPGPLYRDSLRGKHLGLGPRRPHTRFIVTWFFWWVFFCRRCFFFFKKFFQSKSHTALSTAEVSSFSLVLIRLSVIACFW